MTNDCYFLKYQGESNNENLPILNACKISINGTTTVLRFSIYYNSVESKKMYLTGNLYFTDSTGSQNLGTEIAVSTDNAFYVSAGTGVLIVPKYDLTQVSYTYNNTTAELAKVVYSLPELLAYNMTSISQLNISSSADEQNVYGNMSEVDTKCTSSIQIAGNSKLTGSINGLISTSLTSIDIRNTDVELSEEKLLICTTLEILLMNTKCAYNFDNLGIIPSLTNISSNRNNCVGSVEGFVTKAKQARVAAGGDGSGSITALLFRQTFPNVIVPDGAPDVINGFSWDAQGNITWN